MENHTPPTRRGHLAETLEVYHNAHKWLILPIIVILIAFTPFYFSTFLSEPWGYHLHALPAIAWYLLMITQPYLATRGKLPSHRKWGMLGLLIAGWVVASALIITPTNVYFGHIGGFPPTFPAEFFYGLTFTETLAIIGFGASVVMAILRSKIPDEHAVWMLGTVFFGFMPAWLRISIVPILLAGLDLSMWLIFLFSLPFAATILFVGYRLGKLRHPAILLSAALTLGMASTNYVGGLEWYQEWITDLMKPMVPWPDPPAEGD